MKSLLIFLGISFLSLSVFAQTNTFPTSGNVGIGTTSPQTKLEVNGLITGGFGARTTSGTLDWNHITNSRPGSGHTLLRGNTALNAPSTTAMFFHPFNFEYGSSKDGNGNITQLAIPYGYEGSINEGIYMRGSYSGSWSNWVKILSEDLNGNVGIGTISPDEKLTVKGKIHSEEVIVDLNVPGPDYVFEEEYDLTSLKELEAYIKANKHLPEVPSAAELEAHGIVLGEMNMILLKKIEELTLHMIDIQKQVDVLKKENERLKTEKKQ
ncbi:hypothetical protein A8B79_04285 [Balneola sp. EhC07]|uniref:pyocin knob domain-containing protein n=1 Tax=Balneola sp. EhC07 TaxID=1849360 RepID=UPI0007F395A1|nr:pyocin knob domain-containing protein [Balneola sp. EhC07]OAN61651.1 hypothetical protein A8B79_04285 [Balneola sp. EhC07]